MSDYPACVHCRACSWDGSDPDPKCPFCGKPKFHPSYPEQIATLTRERDEALAENKRLTNEYIEALFNQDVKDMAARAELIRERDALRLHYDAAGPEHDLLALLDLYRERETAALERVKVLEEALQALLDVDQVLCDETAGRREYAPTTDEAWEHAIRQARSALTPKDTDTKGIV